MTFAAAIRDPGFWVISAPLAALFILSIVRIGRPFK